MFEYAIALTGGIATGKSQVARYFQQKGYGIIDADKIAHRILNEQSQEIAKAFGSELLVEGMIDRKALGAIVFKSKSKRQQLEGLLHPLIYAEIVRLSLLLDALKKPYFIEIPLFFETKRYEIERILLVYAPKEIQKERLMQRDGLTQEEAQLRLNAQLDIESKRRDATYIIENSTTKEALFRACLACEERILKEFE
jgi:dephospho-CoA kinase